MRLFSFGTVIAVLAGLAVGGASSPDVRLPATLVAPATETPVLLGVLDGRNSAKLVHVDPLTVRAKSKPRLELGGAYPWAFSADRSALAAVRQRDSDGATLRVVSVKRMKRLGDIALGRGYVHTVRWVAPGRVLAAMTDCCPRVARFHVVDTTARRIAESREIAGSIIRLEHGSEELVALMAPSTGIGPARLAVFEPSGRLRSVGLDGVGAGWSPRRSSSPSRASRGVWSRGLPWMLPESGHS